MKGIEQAHRRLLSVVALLLAAVLAPDVGAAASFAPELTFTDSGQRHRMVFTGEDERVVVIFRVYDIAHYVEAAGDQASYAAEQVVSDGPAKAIVIRFARKLSREKIRYEFDKAIRRNAEPDWLERADDTIDAFIAAIDRDALADDQLVYYWLPGGRLFAEYNGERMFTAADEDFAKLIWSIWFGADPVCDREKLLAALPTTPVGR